MPPADSEGVSNRTVVVASVVAAVVVAGSLGAVFALRSHGSPKPQAPVVGAARVGAMLRGIPQQGTMLGDSSARVTLVEFADPQCPYCGDWERGALPTIVRRYVRPGKIRIDFEGLAFVGPDSMTALRTALAAARQDRFWNVIELLYENQGEENTGWVTDSLLRAVGAAVPGLDTARMLADRSSTAVNRALLQANATARNAGVSSTPTFGIVTGGGEMQLVHVTSLDASALMPALDAALRS